MSNSNDIKNPDNYFFGHPKSVNVLSDNLNDDPTIKNVLSGIAGGNGTQDYFRIVDNFSKMLGSVGNSGNLSGWNTASMEDGTTSYYQQTTDGKNTYTVTMQAKDFDIDEKGNIKPKDTKVVIDGKTFNGIGHIAANMIINDSIVTEVTWVVGTCAAGDLAWLVIKSIVQTIIDSAAENVAQSMGRLVKGPGGGLVIEEWAAAEELAGAQAMTSKTGVRSFLKNLGRPGPIACLIIVAAITIALALVLHQSYHRVRIWNLTRYKLLWDKSDNFYFYEGNIQDGPYDPEKKPAPFGPVCSSSPFPGAKAVNQAHFGDFNIVSDSLIHGIGWAMRAKLVDPQNEGDVKYTCTLMFDIPFAGDNSLSATFDQINNLQTWYSSQEGVHRDLRQSATSADGEITTSMSYDYLSGKHPIPSNTGVGTDAYFYQSVVSFVEKDIATKPLPKCRCL